jgi:hypothetical protein
LLLTYFSTQERPNKRTEEGQVEKGIVRHLREGGKRIVVYIGQRGERRRQVEQSKQEHYKY